ncbi:MAG TPA: hypothetical protein VGD38_09075, partial [Pyrinomonadaceae bacterium]
MRILLLFIALASFSAAAHAQSPAIQPCEATPSPGKPGASTPAKTGVRSSQTGVDASIPDD